MNTKSIDEMTVQEIFDAVDSGMAEVSRRLASGNLTGRGGTTPTRSWRRARRRAGSGRPRSLKRRRRHSRKPAPRRAQVPTEKSPCSQGRRILISLIAIHGRFCNKGTTSVGPPRKH